VLVENFLVLLRVFFTNMPKSNVSISEDEVRGDEVSSTYLLELRFLKYGKDNQVARS